MKIQLHLTGAKALILHNGRLANPLDPYTRQLGAISKKRNKTDEDRIEMMRIEARGAAYETADNLLGVPTLNIWASLHIGAKQFKRGKDIERGLICDADHIEPLLVSGEPVDVDEYLSDPDHIDYRSVRVQSSRTMRARPIVQRWSCSHEFEMMDDIFDFSDFEPIVRWSGLYVGLMEWRPIFGTYTATIEQT